MTASASEPRRRARAGSAGALTGTVDFNVHGLLGIRLVDPSDKDVRTVESHLGLKPEPLAGEPEVTVRFVDTLPVSGPLRYLGREDVGFTDDAFVVLRSRNLARARVQLAFETLGERCQFTCEKDLPGIPLFRQLINLAMLAKGVLPVHAAAFNYADQGVLVTGWSHGSKTGSLLAFMAAGARFIGDEWIYISLGGESMYGLPDQLEARPWYLRELPEYQKHVGRTERMRLSLAGGLARILAPMVSGSEKRNSLGAKVTRQFHQALADQQSIHMRPRTLFGPETCVLESSLDLVIVAISHAAPGIVMTATGTEHLAKQMAASFQHEQASLISTYQKHLFAFPDRRNALLDDAERIYGDLARKALAGKRAHTMYHPYPVSTVDLRNAIGKLLT